MRITPGLSVVVTGAASGIGRALTRRLVARGCNVAGIDRQDSDDGPSAATLWITADVSHPDDIEAAAARVAAAWGSTHLLINCAGLYLQGRIAEQDPAAARRLLDVNIGGVLWSCRAFLPGMIAARRGHVVNLSSIYGRIGSAGRSTYCATKWAIAGFSESLRAEVEEHGIRVTCVYPAAVRTAIVAQGTFTNPSQRAFEQTALQTMGLEPDTVASAILRAVRRDVERLRIGW